MTHPSICEACGNSWRDGHRSWCPIHREAVQRRKEAHKRAAIFAGENNRADVIARPSLARVLPLRSFDGKCPRHPAEDSVTCAYCADVEVDA